MSIIHRIEKIYRAIFHFFMALASTSLLPAVYFIKSHCEVFHTASPCLNLFLDLSVYLGVPVLFSILSLLWMKIQGKDSINYGVTDITPVNHEYLPVYLGYIFVSLSLPNKLSCGLDLKVMLIVYILICLFVTCSKTLCFNPLFIVFGYGYYQVTTSNGVRVFVITRRIIRKSGGNPIFPHLTKVNELVYVDKEKNK